MRNGLLKPLFLLMVMTLWPGLVVGQKIVEHKVDDATVTDKVQIDKGRIDLIGENSAVIDDIAYKFDENTNFLNVRTEFIEGQHVIFEWSGDYLITRIGRTKPSEASGDVQPGSNRYDGSPKPVKPANNNFPRLENGVWVN